MESCWMSLLMGGIGVVFVALGVPLWRERIGVNPFYGVRTSTTMRDPVTWYRVNRLFGRDFTFGGVVIVVVAGLSHLLIGERRPTLVVMVDLGVALTVVIVASVRALLAAGRTAR